MSDFFICPHCGAEVDIDATVCPECGSDEETGWSDVTVYDGLYLYEDDYSPSEGGSSRWMKITILAILAFILAAFVAATVPWGIYIIPFIILASAAAYYFMEVAPHLRSNQEKKIYNTLLVRAGGDEAMVGRWISYERERTPDSDDLDLMEAALYRWQRDNS